VPPPPTTLINSKEEYEVEAILDSQMHYNSLEYLVEFKGYDEGHCKGTSIRFLTSSFLSYSPPVYMYFLSSPLYHLQGLHLQPMTSILTAR
jgi:hypothetical protein